MSVRGDKDEPVLALDAVSVYGDDALAVVIEAAEAIVAVFVVALGTV